MIDKLWKWLVEAVKETLNLSWTLVGLIIATLTLTGQAQQVTAIATVVTLAIWLLTIGTLEKEDGSLGNKMVSIVMADNGYTQKEMINKW